VDAAVVEVAVDAPALVVAVGPALVVVDTSPGEGPAVVELPRVDDVVLEAAALPPLPLLPQAAVASATGTNASRAPGQPRLVPEITAGTITDTVPGMDLERLEALELTGADGATHRLGDLWSRRPVILVYLRHFG
jgi:hypothetical protein